MEGGERNIVSIKGTGTYKRTLCHKAAKTHAQFFQKIMSAAERFSASASLTYLCYKAVKGQVQSTAQVRTPI